MNIISSVAPDIPETWKQRARNAAANTGVVVQVVAIVLGVLLAVRIYTLPKPTEAASSPYTWGSLTDQEKAEIDRLVSRLPKRRVPVVRPDTSDYGAIADDFAGIFGDHSELVAPPQAIAGISVVGLTIFAPRNPDGVVRALQAGISKTLNVQVDIDEMNPALYAGLNPDFVLWIGSKKRPSFLLDGSEAVQANAKTAVVRIKGVDNYSVSAWTSWGASVTVTEIARDHFTVEFSAPAPMAAVPSSTPAPTGASVSATSAAQPTTIPTTGQLIWIAFHYP